MFKKIAAGIVGVLSLIYIFNPTAGILEIIPDNIPGVGNLDEVTFSIVIIGILRYFNIDLTKKFGPAIELTKNEEEEKKMNKKQKTRRGKWQKN